MERQRSEAQSPLEQLIAAFKTVKKGEMPALTKESLLADMQLDGEESDGREFLDRLNGGRGLSGFRRGISLIFHVQRLVKETNARTATPEQEALASILGAVVSRHLLREQEGCGVVTLAAVDSRREDIIPLEAKHIAIHLREDF